MKRSKTPKPAAIRRRDGSGHIDPAYAADLLERAREGKEADARPFVENAPSTDPTAEDLAEEFVEAATSAQSEGQEVLDRKMTEEDGGPFIQTAASTEFAPGTDESNIEEATREPFPTT